jgi:hypothetical protein
MLFGATGGDAGFVLSEAAGVALSGATELDAFLLEVSVESGSVFFLPRFLQELNVKLKTNKTEATSIANVFLFTSIWLTEVFVCFMLPHYIKPLLQTISVVSNRHLSGTIHTI